MAESLNRADRGVGVVWSPTSTEDARRPSSIYCRGVSSLWSADTEFAMLAGAQTKVKSPVAHFIFSLNAQESRTVSDATLIKLAEATLDGAGWKGHALVAATHRDSMLNADGSQKMNEYGELDGNLHCHVVVASIHSEHGRAYNRSRDNQRLSLSLREQESKFGLSNDHGIGITRDRGLETERYEPTVQRDWEARAQENALERLARQAKHFVADHNLESIRDREDRLVHGIRQYLERCAERKERPLASDVHLIAARLTCKIENIVDGQLTVRLMERAEEGRERKTPTDAFGDSRTIKERWQPTETVFRLDEKRIVRSALEEYTGKRAPGRGLEKAHAQALEQRAFVRDVGTAEAAETQYRQAIQDDPGRVTRDLVYGNGQANFDADDVSAAIAAHLTKGWGDAADYVLRSDPQLRILSVDTPSPLYSIAPQQDITSKYDALLRRLLSEKDPLFDRAALDKAIAIVEARQREKTPGFTFTDEQRKVFDGFENRLLVLAGEAGTGKSILSEVHREMAELSGRKISGFAVAQRAADQLAASSGIKSVNQARALVEESRDGASVIPQDGRFVYDEYSMASIESGVAMLERAIAANASGVVQGDGAQLGPISPGNSFGLATRAAEEAGTLVRLKDVFRQQEGTSVEWLRFGGVQRGGTAIREANAEAFRAHLEQFVENGHVQFHETRELEIAAVAADIVAAMRNGERVIAPERSYQDCLYINRKVREELGLAGTGQEFVFDRGMMEIAVGDRIMFRANSRTLAVKNGDTASVTGLSQDKRGRWTIEATLDNGKIVTFDPNRYRKIEGSFSNSIHSSQGSQAPTVIGSITKSDDARSFHVTATRTEKVLRLHTHLKREEMLEHLTSKRALAPPSDAVLFDFLVAQTGGPGTDWARAVKKAREFSEDPLRQRHVEVMRQRRAGFREAVIDILGQTDIGERERKRLLAAAAKRFAPQTFVSWAASERRTLDAEFAARQRVIHEPHLAREQERSQTQKREAERAQAIERAPEQKKKRGMRH